MLRRRRLAAVSAPSGIARARAARLTLAAGAAGAPLAIQPQPARAALLLARGAHPSAGAHTAIGRGAVAVPRTPVEAERRLAVGAAIAFVAVAYAVAAAVAMTTAAVRAAARGDRAVGGHKTGMADAVAVRAARAAAAAVVRARQMRHVARWAGPASVALAGAVPAGAM